MSNFEMFGYNSKTKNIEKSPKKIVFHDDTDIKSKVMECGKESRKKSNLFGSDNENEGKYEFGWNEEELEAKASLKNKLIKLQTNIGNDNRFVLDERFIDDNEDKEKEEAKQDLQSHNDQSELNEKSWQMNILGYILGKPVTKSTMHDNKSLKRTSKMLRYDPTLEGHKKYEIANKTIARKKKTNNNHKMKQNTPIPTSNIVYYDVSNSLLESLKQNKGFSLLKTLRKNDIKADEQHHELIMNSDEVSKRESSFKFKFALKNPFEYDSSDDESENKKNSSTKFTMPNHHHGELFFSHNDTRFEKARHFFKATPVEDDLKHRRRELKEIVRCKLRNNFKKSIPWVSKKARKLKNSRPW